VLVVVQKEESTGMGEISSGSSYCEKENTHFPVTLARKKMMDGSSIKSILLTNEPHELTDKISAAG
jgi:hypothetical protein